MLRRFTTKNDAHDERAKLMGWLSEVISIHEEGETYFVIRINGNKHLMCDGFVR